MSLLAVAYWPYDYYVLLRWVVSAASVSLMYLASKNQAAGWYVLAVPVFILWFPFFGITMDRSSWFALDVLAGIGFIAAGKSSKLHEADS